jgi:hypothetical protein
LEKRDWSGALMKAVTILVSDEGISFVAQMNINPIIMEVIR